MFARLPDILSAAFAFLVFSLFTPSLAIVVTGTAGADRFESARLELGEGQAPGKWKAVGKKIRKPVKSAELGNIRTRVLAGSNQWTIRLTVEHKDGSERVSWFLLNLGQSA